jgi:heme/copper-type cytochrome/quinol oxidase subunit 2
MIKKLFIFLLVMVSLAINAQEVVQEPQMADAFRADGKIYVVIAVMATVFLCVLLYLIVIERKLKKLEDQIKDKK